MDLTKLAIEPLDRRHDRAAFSCDEPSLTDYLHRQARQDVDRDLASCWVLCAQDGTEIIGYYTLTATSVDVSSLPADLAKKSGRYHAVGAALLGRLAVDSRYARQGLGSHLLLNALRRVLRTTERGIAVKAVMVDALHERAATFYEKFGFQRIEEVGSGEGDEHRANRSICMVLSLKTIRAIFPGEGIELDQD